MSSCALLQTVTIPVVLPDGVIFSFCYKDGIIYSSYNYSTLIRTEWESGKSEVISESTEHVQLMNDRIWYPKAANRTISLYSNNLEYTDERQEVTGMGGMFQVLGDVIVYMGEDKKTYYLYDTNGATRGIKKAAMVPQPKKSKRKCVPMKHQKSCHGATAQKKQVKMCTHEALKKPPWCHSRKSASENVYP